MEYCKCGGSKGYLLQDGQLICQSCGGLSPKAKLVGEEFVKIGEGRIVCPHCGHVIQEAKNEISERPEVKEIYPSESKRIYVRSAGRPSKK